MNFFILKKLVKEEYLFMGNTELGLLMLLDDDDDDDDDDAS